MKRAEAAILAGVLTLAGLGACGSDDGEVPSISSPSPATDSQATPTSPTSSEAATQDEDVIREFFGLIDAGRAADAVQAMSAAAAGDDTGMQAWGVQFDAITSVKVLSVTPSAPEEWSASRHTYTVLLEVTMDPASANAPIPYYGYVSGENVRWVTLVDEEGAWRIDTIATGP